MGTLSVMARTPKHLEPFDRLIAEALQALVEKKGATYRPLAEKSGVGLNRLGIILRGEEPPATIGEIDRIARALGSSASAILAEAEATTTSAGRVVGLPRRGEADQLPRAARTPRFADIPKSED